MKRKKMIILLLLPLFVTMEARNFRILFLNYPQIWINGKASKVGDVFDENAVIKWSKERQAMKVIDLNSKKRYLMVCKPTGKKEQTIMNILTNIEHLSTHGPGSQMGDSFDQLANDIQQTYDLLDSIVIPANITIDKSHYFIGTYKYGDTRLTKKLSCENGNIIIDKNIFFVDDKKLEPRDIILRIDYVAESLNNTIFIKDNIEITIIPRMLE